jgi:hypothetical protein
MHGLTRLANIDVSNNFGNDSLLAFGSPDTLDQKGWTEWAGNALIGASGGEILKTMDSIRKGEYMNAIPFPKVIKDIYDGLTLRGEGKVDPETGKQYHKPYSLYQAAVKMTGAKPADEARAFEAGGDAAASKALKKTANERKTLMSRWRNAGPAEQQRIFQHDVQRWNASHKNPDDKIQMQDLLRSRTSESKYQKRLEKAEQYD